MAASADRRMYTNVALLAVAQALLLTTIVGGVAIGALAGQTLTADPALATLPIAALVVGPFLASWPASSFMARYGRRAGFSLGAALGVTGGAVEAAHLKLERSSLEVGALDFSICAASKGFKRSLTRL